MTPILDILGVSKAFAGRTILGDLSLSLMPGEHLLLLGPSGSGKSTLINLVTGLLTPDQGEISIAGEPMSSRSATGRDDLRRRRVGIIFQTLRLVSALSVRANLRLAQKLCCGRGDEIAIDDLLTRLDLAHRADAKPRELSHGEAQRAAIARALVGRPDLLVADEPTSAVDDANAAAIAGLLLETAKAQGTTLLIATHDQRLRPFVPSCLLLPALRERA